MTLRVRAWRLYEATLLFICAGLVAWQLFVPPSLGIADNNDFPKLMGKFCLGPESQKDYVLYDWASFRFRRDPRYCWESGLTTSGILPARLALVAGSTFLPAGRFDLRVLGAVYALVFLAAFYGLQRLVRPLRPAARLLVPAAAIAVFVNASYVPCFSTFFFDTPAFVFLMLTAVALCWLVFRETVRTPLYALAVACVVLFATSKSQHAPLALVAIPCLWLSFGRKVFPSRPVRIGAIAAVVVAVVAMLTAAPRFYATTALYNAFFYKALPQSKTPAADLAGLGIDASMISYVGRHAFLPDSPLRDPQRTAELARHLSASRLAAYYLAHPRVAWLVLADSFHDGSLQHVRMTIGEREYRLGNYERSTGRPPEAQSRFFDFWSELKIRLFGGRPLLYTAYALALFAALWTLVLRLPAERRSRAATLAFTLTGMAGAAAVIVMFDGVDNGRHLFLFNTLLDIGVCALFSFCAIPSWLASPSPRRACRRASPSP